MDKHDSGAIWYPFTQAKTAAPPIHIERAKGCILYTKDGSEYIDAVSSWWVNIHGHSHPHVAESIAAQALKMEHVIFAGFTHSPAIELAERLVNILPEPIEKIFFSDNGSTAVEVAIKMAMQYWHNSGIHHKKRIVAFDHAYHGDTFGAMSVGAKSAFNAAFESYLFHVDHLPVPDTNTVDHVLAQFESWVRTGDVAAFIYEPLVQGAGGMLMHEPEHLEKLMKIARQYEVICIADEVMTGFGRTGKNFASEYMSETPDIMCLSKGITGGFMPLGVTACTQHIFNSFYSDDVSKTFFHGHSYTANPLACAAANASLDILLSASCQADILRISERHTLFAKSIETEDCILEVRHRGTIIAIEFRTAEGTSYFHSVRDHLYQFCLERGVLLRPLGNVLYIMPPYCITEAELNKTYDVIKQVIKTFKSF
jgi:adenosylmethionine-8-amino-7-oxononanoate aminotransferase